MTPPTMKARRTEPMGRASARPVRRRLFTTSGGSCRALRGLVAAAMDGRLNLSLRHRVGNGGRPRLDLADHVIECAGDVRRHRREATIDHVTNAVVREAEGGNAAREAVVMLLLDGGVNRRVDALQRAGNYRLVHRLSVRGSLVGVDADAPDALFARFGEDAVATAARDLEHDVGAFRNLVGGDARALRWVSEIVRIAVDQLDSGVDLLGHPLVAGDVVVDRRIFTPPTEPIVFLFFGPLPSFSRTPAMVPTSAPA